MLLRKFINKSVFCNVRFFSQGLEGFTIDSLPAPGNPFHLAIPVHDLHQARTFYGNVLGLIEGRRSDNKWQDYSLYGHQIVCHYVGESYRCQDFYNPVDGDEVPVPHFGIVLEEQQFSLLAERLEKSDINFIIKPHKRFIGMQLYTILLYSCEIQYIYI